MTSNLNKQQGDRSFGTVGFVLDGGRLREEEANPELRGSRKYQTYKNKVLNVSIVAAGVRYFLNLISKTGWKVKQPNEPNDPELAKERASLISNMMHDMKTPWYRVTRRAAMFRFYGFSVQEIITKKRDDGYIGVFDISPRPQNTIDKWETDSFGNVTTIIQLHPNSYQELAIPRNKCLYLVDDTLLDSPEGYGIFRQILPICTRLGSYEQLEFWGFQSDLRGMPVLKAPLAMLKQQRDDELISKKEYKEIIDTLTNFVQKHDKNPSLGMLLDSITYQSEDQSGTPSNVGQYGLELLSNNSTTQQEMHTAIERLNQEIARVLGVEGMLLGSTNYGSQALSEDKSQNFSLIVDSALREIAQALNKDFVERIFELNGWDKADMPTMEPNAVRYRSITDMTQAVLDLASAGAVITPNHPLVSEIYELLGLDASTPEDQELINDTEELLNILNNTRGEPDDSSSRGE